VLVIVILFILPIYFLFWVHLACLDIHGNRRLRFLWWTSEL